MSKLKALVCKLGQDQEGAALIEYTVLLGVLIVAIIASIGVVGGWISGQWSTLSTTI